MGFMFRSAAAFTTLLFLFAALFSTLSSALDMSILSYDQTHGIQSSNWRSDEEVMTMYEEWLVKHHKVYNSLEEKEKRFEVFKDNLRFIDEHNSGNWTYTVGLNQFSDLTNEEYRAMYLMPPRATSRSPWEGIAEPSNQYLNHTGVLSQPPASIDWRARGAVTPVRNQGKCGSCYAFTTVAAVEGIYQITAGNLVILSEQELVDCSSSGVYGNDGCGGGYNDASLRYVRDSNGLYLGSVYPYVGIKQNCYHYPTATRYGAINGYLAVPFGEQGLQNIVATQPVATYVNSTTQEFKQYTGGIFSGPCNQTTDHCVAVVGYGTENGVDYWIVKNSWGQNWGENGYMRLRRNGGSSAGTCGIAAEAYYPVRN